MKPRVVLGPRALAGLQAGIRQVVAAVQPTLGPRPRVVAVQRPHRAEAPELLDDAGLIARRLTQLTDRDADLGAMLVRQVLWRQRQAAGDGVATAAVLYQAVFDGGVKHLAAGGNAMRLRAHLEAALPRLQAELQKQITPLAGRPALEHLARSLCLDETLAPLLGEVFDVLGEHGHLAVRRGHGRETEREYIEGTYWESGLADRRLMTAPGRQRSELVTPALLLTDLEFDDPRALLPVLLGAREAGHAGLVIVARTVSAEVVTLLANAGRPPASFPVIAVKTPGTGAAAQAAALEDLAVLTGGRRLVQAAGDTAASVRIADFGRARRVWADLEYFGLVGGQGDPLAVRAQLAQLETAWERADDLEKQEALQARLGRLLGGSATLLIGGVSDAEIQLRRERAERAARVLRGALRAGVVPGGGAALLAGRPVLRRRLKQTEDADERAALRILVRALEAPARVLIANAGYEPGALIPQFGAGQGLDVRCGAIVEMRPAGLVDSAAVTARALHSAVTGAALALTVETLVQHANPSVSAEP